MMGSSYSCPECGKPQHGCCIGELCWDCQKKEDECRLKNNGRSLREQRYYELQLLLEKEKNVKK